MNIVEESGRVPGSLPERLFLLACDPEARRVTAGDRLGLVLRAGALAELLLAGRIVDDAGRPRACTGSAGTPAPGAGALLDPLLDPLLREITASKPRRWRHWIRRDARDFSRAVRDRLEDGGWIRVELRRPMGIFSRTRITVRDPRVVKRLVSQVSEALRSGRPVARMDPLQATLAALAAAGEVPTVLPRRERRLHRQRIEKLGEPALPIPDALHKAVQAQRSAAAGG